MIKTVCPRCEGDYVARMRVKGPGRIVFVCPECDALWRDSSSIDGTVFEDLEQFLSAADVEPSWAALEPAGDEDEIEGR